MIGPAEIDDMMAEYAEAVAEGDAVALAREPVWSVSPASSALPADLINPLRQVRPVEAYGRSPT